MSVYNRVIGNFYFFILGWSTVSLEIGYMQSKMGHPVYTQQVLLLSYIIFFPFAFHNNTIHSSIFAV